MKSQQGFDYARARQCELVRNCVLPDVEIVEGRRRVKVKAHVLKHLLGKIDQSAGKTGTCWKSYETLVRETQLSINSIERGMKALKQLGILQIERKPFEGGFQYHRRIVFANLVDFHAELSQCEEHEASSQLTEASSFLPKEAVPTEREAVPTERGGTPHGEGRHSPPVGTKASEASLNIHRGFTRVTREGGTGDLDLHQGEKPKPTLLKPRTGLPVNSQEPAAKKPGLCLIPNLQPEALSDPDTVQALYDLACERGLYKASQQHRLAWFGFCHQLRHWQGCENPVGALSRVLSQGMAHAVRIILRVQTQQDEDWARRAIREHDQRWAEAGIDC